MFIKAVKVHAALAAFFFAAQLGAVEYFVDGKSQTADDAGPGTAEKPLKTVSAGAAKLKPGDVLTIRAGVYREAVKVTASGTKEAPITIRAAKGEHVVVTGADLLKGWKRFEGARKKPVWVLKPFPAWKRFKYDPHEGHGRGAGPQLIFDNRLLNESPTLERLTVAGFYYDRSGGGTLYLWPPPARTGPFVTDKSAEWWDAPVNLASEDPNDHQIEASVRYTPFAAVNVSHVIVRGLHARHTVGHAQAPALSVSGEHVTVEDCVVEFSHGRGLSSSGRNIVVRNCLVRYNGASGAGGCLKNSLWENNCLVGNTTRGHSHGWEAGGVKFVKSNRLTVRGCRFIDNNGPGLWFDWDNSEIIVERNFCSGNIGSGIMMEVSPGFASKGVDAGPVVAPDYGVKKKGYVPDPRTPGPTILRNNIVVNQRHDGTWGHGILLQLASNTFVLNNTVYGSAAYGIFLRYHPYDNHGHRIVDNAVMNNIVSDNGGCQIYINPDPKDKPGYVARNTSDYNLFFNSFGWLKDREKRNFPWSSRAENWSRWGKTQFMSTYSREEWTKMYGYDAHSLQGDPRFVSAGALDFQLLPDSPAVAAGKPTGHVTDDFFGRPRPKNRPPSMGAIEFFAGHSIAGPLSMKGR